MVFCSFKFLLCKLLFFSSNNLQGGGPEGDRQEPECPPGEPDGRRPDGQRGQLRSGHSGTGYAPLKQANGTFIS